MEGSFPLEIYSYKYEIVLTSQSPQKEWNAIGPHLKNAKIEATFQHGEDLFTVGFRWSKGRLKVFEVDGFVELPQSIPWGQKALSPHTSFLTLTVNLFVGERIECSFERANVWSQIDYIKLVTYLSERDLLRLRKYDNFFSSSSLEFSLPSSDKRSSEEEWISVDCLGTSLHLDLTQKILESAFVPAS